MNGYEPVERDEDIQSAISNMIWLEYSFVLARVWCIRDLGCPFVFYTAFGRDWDLMTQVCIYILLFIYICDDMNICYLLLIIRCWFCFWVGDYPLSVWLLNPSIYSFFPQVWLLLVAYSLVFSYVTQIGGVTSWVYKPCNMWCIFVNVYNLNSDRVMYCISFESLCKATCADHLLGHYFCN